MDLTASVLSSGLDMFMGLSVVTVILYCPVILLSSYFSSKTGTTEEGATKPDQVQKHPVEGEVLFPVRYPPFTSSWSNNSNL